MCLLVFVLQNLKPQHLVHLHLNLLHHLITAERCLLNAVTVLFSGLVKLIIVCSFIYRLSVSRVWWLSGLSMIDSLLDLFSLCNFPHELYSFLGFHYCGFLPPLYIAFLWASFAVLSWLSWPALIVLVLKHTYFSISIKRSWVYMDMVVYAFIYTTLETEVGGSLWVGCHPDIP